MFEGQQKKMAFTTNKLTGWKIAGTFFVSEIHDAASPVMKMALIILAVSLIVGGVLIFLSFARLQNRSKTCFDIS